MFKVLVLTVAWMVVKPPLVPHFASALPAELYDVQRISAGNYAFKYDVEEVSTRTSFGHEESRAGPYTLGSYHVLLPDGRRQRVVYEVQGDSGLISHISYENDNTFGGQGGVSHSSAVGFLSKQLNTDRKINSFDDLGGHSQLTNTLVESATSPNIDVFAIASPRSEFEENIYDGSDTSSLNFEVTPSTVFSDISSLDGTKFSSEQNHDSSTIYGTTISPDITNFVSHSFDPPGSLGNTFINTHSTNAISENQSQLSVGLSSVNEKNDKEFERTNNNGQTSLVNSLSHGLQFQKTSLNSFGDREISFKKGDLASGASVFVQNLNDETHGNIGIVSPKPSLTPARSTGPAPIFSSSSQVPFSSDFNTTPVPNLLTHASVSDITSSGTFDSSFSTTLSPPIISTSSPPPSSTGKFVSSFSTTLSPPIISTSSPPPSSTAKFGSSFSTTLSPPIISTSSPPPSSTGKFGSSFSTTLSPPIISTSSPPPSSTGKFGSSFSTTLSPPIIFTSSPPPSSTTTSSVMVSGHTSEIGVSHTGSSGLGLENNANHFNENNANHFNDIGGQIIMFGDQPALVVRAPTQTFRFRKELPVSANNGNNIVRESSIQSINFQQPIPLKNNFRSDLEVGSLRGLSPISFAPKGEHQNHHQNIGNSNTVFESGVVSTNIFSPRVDLINNVQHNAQPSFSNEASNSVTHSNVLHNVHPSFSKEASNSVTYSDDLIQNDKITVSNQPTDTSHGPIIPITSKVRFFDATMIGTQDTRNGGQNLIQIGGVNANGQQIRGIRILGLVRNQVGDTGDKNLKLFNFNSNSDNGFIRGLSLRPHNTGNPSNIISISSSSQLSSGSNPVLINRIPVIHSNNRGTPSLFNKPTVQKVPVTPTSIGGISAIVPNPIVSISRLKF